MKHKNLECLGHFMKSWKYNMQQFIIQGIIFGKIRVVRIAPISAKMPERPLKWFRHFHRALFGTVVHIAINHQVSGIRPRPRGRPKKRLQD